MFEGMCVWYVICICIVYRVLFKFCISFGVCEGKWCKCVLLLLILIVIVW